MSIAYQGPPWLTPQVAAAIAEDRRHEFVDDARDDDLHDLLDDLAWADGDGE